MNKPSDKTTLRRSLSLPLITLYGLGNILGAGVYVLIGKVAGEAGYGAAGAFLIASVIAGITAFSFAELSSRFPLSAGEAVYVQNGFHIQKLSLTVGLLIVLTGVVSAATIAKGFVGYLDVFVVLPHALVIICLLAILGLVATWGIFESVSTAAVFTILEIAGLLLILYVAAPALQEFPQRAHEFVPVLNASTFSGLIGGAFLAFYAYVGFEDMVNVAEEVKNPEKNMPIAILIALLCATVLYLLIAVSSLLVLSPLQLSQSEAPMASIYQAMTGNKPWLISMLSLFAVVNGGLIQIIMASRVCYGLAQQNWLPAILGIVHARTQTPANATVLVTVLIAIAALWLPIEVLANITTYLLLIVFSLVNLALVNIKRREKNAIAIEEAGYPPAPSFRTPIAVPMLGFVICFGFVLAQSLALLLT